LTDTQPHYCGGMSYTVSLGCGCQVYVSCHPRSGVAHTRVIEFRSSRCAIRSHDVGVRIPAWELLRYEPDDPGDPGDPGEAGAAVVSGTLQHARR
jgi:hypothetical protein